MLQNLDWYRDALAPDLSYWARLDALKQLWYHNSDGSNGGTNHRKVYSGIVLAIGEMPAMVAI